MGQADQLASIPSHIPAIAGAALTSVGRAPNGPLTIQRHWGISTILSVPTAGGTAWFKHVPQLFAHEGAVTACLAQIAPTHLPPVLSCGQGWMLMDEMPSSPQPATEHPLSTLAAIQIASAEHLPALAAAGCPRITLDALVAELAAFERHAALLTPEQRQGCDASLPALAETCARMDELAIPTTIVHGDFYSSNALWGPSGWIIYDWTDACLGNPFIDVVYPMMRREPGAREAFRRVWLMLLPEETVEQALELAPIIGVAYHLVMHGRIFDHVTDPEPFRGSLESWLQRLSVLAHEVYQRAA